MKQTDVLITDIGKNGPFVNATFASPTLQPGLGAGRFVLADLGGYLRTPLFPSRIENKGFDVLVPPDHPAAALRAGAKVNLIGPLGRGFQVPEIAHRLLLVADTDHLPVLLPLVQPKPGPPEKPSFSIALLLTAPTAAELYPIQLLPSALEVHVVTADGSAGRKGPMSDLFRDLVRWADCVCIASVPTIYPALAEIVRETRVGPARRFAQALIVPTMACGVGACQGCAVKVARGTKLACTDGPVFDLLELSPVDW